jgi:hypothetical protein
MKVNRKMRYKSIPKNYEPAPRYNGLVKMLKPNRHNIGTLAEKVGMNETVLRRKLKSGDDIPVGKALLIAKELNTTVEQIF